MSPQHPQHAADYGRIPDFAVPRQSNLYLKPFAHASCSPDANYSPTHHIPRPKDFIPLVGTSHVNQTLNRKASNAFETFPGPYTTPISLQFMPVQNHLMGSAPAINHASSQQRY